MKRLWQELGNSKYTIHMCAVLAVKCAKPLMFFVVGLECADHIVMVVYISALKTFSRMAASAIWITCVCLWSQAVSSALGMLKVTLNLYGAGYTGCFLIPSQVLHENDLKSWIPVSGSE